jgi:hypothetical protein
VSNTPIEQLVAQYAAEECNFANIPGVIDASLRYVDSMPDSHVRCLLFTLANAHAAALEENAKLRKHAEAMAAQCLVYGRPSAVEVVNAYRAEMGETR